MKALYLEPGVLADCAAWHGTPRIEVLRAEPEAFGARLREAPGVESGESKR